MKILVATALTQGIDADDNIEIAAQLPVGSIIGRNLEQFFLRGSLLRFPSAEQR
jgi:hypothetical protein